MYLGTTYMTWNHITRKHPSKATMFWRSKAEAKGEPRGNFHVTR